MVCVSGPTGCVFKAGMGCRIAALVTHSCRSHHPNALPRSPKLREGLASHVTDLNKVALAPPRALGVRAIASVVWWPGFMVGEGQLCVYE